MAEEKEASKAEEEDDGSNGQELVHKSRISEVM
jgi:hypothetical protein